MKTESVRFEYRCDPTGNFNQTKPLSLQKCNGVSYLGWKVEQGCDGCLFYERRLPSRSNEVGEAI